MMIAILESIMNPDHYINALPIDPSDTIIQVTEPIINELHLVTYTTN